MVQSPTERRHLPVKDKQAAVHNSDTPVEGSPLEPRTLVVGNPVVDNLVAGDTHLGAGSVVDIAAEKAVGRAAGSRERHTVRVGASRTAGQPEVRPLGVLEIPAELVVVPLAELLAESRKDTLADTVEVEIEDEERQPVVMAQDAPPTGATARLSCQDSALPQTVFAYPWGASDPGRPCRIFCISWPARPSRSECGEYSGTPDRRPGLLRTCATPA